nr:retrovirus-related Pol polyprotein from transposon TNT 1-94 [Tanacetum cinerariifolium]
MSRDVITVGSTIRIPLLYQEKKNRKIDHLARSLLIQGLPNDIYSLINSNETAKDLWDDLERQMHGSEYGEQDRKATILYEYETFKAIEGEKFLDTYLRYLQVISDLKKCGYKKDNYPLALVAEKTNVSKRKEKIVVSSDSEGSGLDDFSELKKITALLAKAFNRRKVKCYNCKKEGRFAKDCKKVKVKDYEYFKTKMLLAKKDKDEQVLLVEDRAWMESSSDSDQEINANMIFMAQIEKVLSDSEASSSSANEKISEIVQICLWIIDSGCSKHMTGNRTLLMNFMEKFLETVRFGNNDFVVVAGYGDVVIGSMTIKKRYYVEVLGHNLFSVGQFCDKGLEVVFRKSTCFVRNEDGVDLLTGDRSLNLYTIALEVASNFLICLLAKTSSSQSWLWHQRLSHLNFATINNLVKNNLVQGLPKMKFEIDHLCSACEQGKIHRKHHKCKTGFASNKPLYLLYMDLCGSMRVQSINGKQYVLVVVDDYSRYTWVFFLHSKDEASEVIIFLSRKPK